ncbi:MAG: CBS domain-containing protein [Candidatus Omnitrophica bacterium]|nr:CBS domain-containing protein [Candidatus Omnitrophota bacterium]
MSTVRQLLQEKGFQIWLVSPSASIYEALQLMADKDTGAVLVMEEGKLLGILSERDYARKVVLMGKSSKDTKVKEIMTKEVITTSADKSIVDCMEAMTKYHIRHLPVVESGKVVGIVTIRDVVRKLVSEQEYTIKELEEFISGNFR